MCGERYKISRDLPTVHGVQSKNLPLSPRGFRLVTTLRWE
jgi:hypothetical protein